MIELILFFAVIAAFFGFAYVGGYVIVKAAAQVFQARAQSSKKPKKQKSQAVKVQTVHPVYIAQQNWKLLDTPTYKRTRDVKVTCSPYPTDIEVAKPITMPASAGTTTKKRQKNVDVRRHELQECKKLLTRAN